VIDTNQKGVNVMKNMYQLFVTMIIVIVASMFIGCESNPVMTEPDVNIVSKKVPGNPVAALDGSDVTYTYHYNGFSNYLVITYSKPMGVRNINVNFSKVTIEPRSTVQTFIPFYTLKYSFSDTTLTDSIEVKALDFFLGVRKLGFEGITIDEIDTQKIEDFKTVDYIFSTDQYNYASIFIEKFPANKTTMKVFYNSNNTLGEEKLETPLLVETIQNVEAERSYILSLKFRDHKFWYFSHVEFE